MVRYPVPSLDGPLTASAIHLWLIDYPELSSDTPLYHLVLNDEEQQRASRYLIDSLRHRYIITHGILRSLLAELCDTSPASLPLTTSSYGKPALVDSDIHFNLSYTQRYALIAITRGRPIGVDIEKQRYLKDMNLLAANVFSPAEQQALTGRPDHARQKAFFDIWVRKEAFVKALGIGLSFPLTEVTVSVDGATRVSSIRDDPDAAGDWQLHEVPVPTGWSAALAYEGAAAEVHLWSVPRPWPS